MEGYLREIPDAVGAERERHEGADGQINEYGGRK